MVYRIVSSNAIVYFDIKQELPTYVHIRNHKMASKNTLPIHHQYTFIALTELGVTQSMCIKLGLLGVLKVAHFWRN